MIDSVYAISGEWIDSHSKEEVEAYFQDCLQYHIDTYCSGDKSLCLSAIIHYDEKEPHLHVQSIPLVHDEKGVHLSAKTIMGGRADYQKRQDQFYDRVCKERGLERGERKETALEKKAHKTKREWEFEQLEKRQEAIEKRQRQDAGQELLEAARKEINMPSISPIKVIPEKQATAFRKGEPEMVVLTRDDFETLRSMAATPVGLMKAEKSLSSAIEDKAMLAKMEELEEVAKRFQEDLQTVTVRLRQEMRKNAALEATINIPEVAAVLENIEITDREEYRQRR